MKSKTEEIFQQNAAETEVKSAVSALFLFYILKNH
jgi:hypothetical protein